MQEMIANHFQKTLQKQDLRVHAKLANSFTNQFFDIMPSGKYFV
jgi:hypothetical protein